MRQPYEWENATYHVKKRLIEDRVSDLEDERKTKASNYVNLDEEQQEIVSLKA